MGTKGVRDLAESYFGSHTLQVIRLVSCPVLCIPQDTSFVEIKRIVYAYNYEEEDKNAIKELITWSIRFNAVLDILHITHKDTPAKSGARPDGEIESYFNRPDLNMVNRSTGGTIHEGIDDYLKESKADLLAVLKKKRNFIEELFHSGITRHYAFYADIPVLIFNY
jgi:hypothetical protein